MNTSKKFRPMYPDRVAEILKDLTEISLKDGVRFRDACNAVKSYGLLIGGKEGTSLRRACYILHKKGKLYLASERQLRVLDGEDTKYTEKDLADIKYIANDMDKEGYFDIIATPEAGKVSKIPTNLIKISQLAPHAEDWELLRCSGPSLYMVNNYNF